MCVCVSLSLSLLCVVLVCVSKAAAVVCSVLNSFDSLTKRSESVKKRTNGDHTLHTQYPTEDIGRADTEDKKWDGGSKEDGFE